MTIFGVFEPDPKNAPDRARTDREIHGLDRKHVMGTYGELEQLSAEFAGVGCCGRRGVQPGDFGSPSCLPKTCERLCANGVLTTAFLGRGRQFASDGQTPIC